MSYELAIALIAAPFVGSFLGVLITRLPEGRPIVLGRSACDHCGAVLGWRDLVPLFSYLASRGCCRYCGQKLGPFYPLIELGAVAVVASAALVLSGWLFWVSIALGWCLLVLAAIDGRHLILPDELTLPLIPAGLIVAYAIEPAMVLDHLIGCAVGLIAFLAIAWIYGRVRGREGLGMGDAKLLAGAGAWLGWAALPGVVLIAAASALAVTIARRAARDSGAMMGEIAFGPYIAFAFWTSWLFGPLRWT